MAAAHKKGIGVSFLFGGEKKEGGTCAMLIRESHMVERRAGEGEKKKKTRTGRGMDGAKEVQSASPKKHPALLRLVYSCLEAPHLAAVTSIKLHLYFSTFFGFFLMDLLSFTQFWDKKEGICLYHSKDHEGTETVTSLMTIMKYVD